MHLRLLFVFYIIPFFPGIPGLGQTLSEFPNFFQNREVANPDLNTCICMKPNSRAYSMLEYPARCRSNYRVQFAVDRSVVYFPRRIIAFLLGTPRIRNNEENNLASLLVAPWAKHLTGRLHLYVANRWRGQAVYLFWRLSLTED